MVTWQREHRPCPICSGTDHRRLGRRGGRAHHAGIGEETEVVRCRRCHGVYQSPVLVPSGNPYEELLSDEYFIGHDGGVKRRTGRSLARRAEALLGRKGRLLEVGCGWGELLRGARDEGWTVAGVDMTDWGSRSSDLDIEISPLESAHSLERTYDVVVLAAILEHLYDPEAALRRVFAGLVPGGLVYIDVPNECSLWSRVGNAYMRARGRDWAINLSPAFPPFHVVGFCPRSLRYLLSQTGFATRKLELYSLENRLGKKLGFFEALEYSGSAAFLALGQALGMGAGISCWAERR
jgi:SAM-dependent methyltransferase